VLIIDHGNYESEEMAEEICGRFIVFFRGINRNDFRCNVSLIIPKQRNKFTIIFVFLFFA
jgi:hypothetical protein